MSLYIRHLINKKEVIYFHNHFICFLKQKKMYLESYLRIFKMIIQHSFYSRKVDFRPINEDKKTQVYIQSNFLRSSVISIVEK